MSVNELPPSGRPKPQPPPPPPPKKCGFGPLGQSGINPSSTVTQSCEREFGVIGRTNGKPGSSLEADWEQARHHTPKRGLYAAIRAFPGIFWGKLMAGHGHVTPNPDGSKKRCGGPGLCSACDREAASQTQNAARPKLPIGFSVTHAHHVDVWECDWDNRFERVNEILSLSSHPHRPDYVVREIAIAPVYSEFNAKLEEAKITVTYRYIGEALREPTVNVTISGEAN